MLCCYGFSQGWKSLYNTAVYVIKFVTYNPLFTWSYIFLNVKLYHSSADYRLVGGKVCINGRTQSFLLKSELIGSNNLYFYV